MATRRPLFFDQTDYSSAEMANSDDVVLGKLVLEGIGGVALDGGHNLASNFASPVTPDDLATKSYVDAVASGLDVHEPVYVKTPEILSLAPLKAYLALTGLGTLANLDTVVQDATGGAGGNATTVEIIGDSGSGVTINEAGYPAIIIHYEAGVSTRANIETAIGLSTHLEVKTPGVATGAVTGGLTAHNLAHGQSSWVAAGTGVGKTLTAPTSSVAYNTIDGKALTVGKRVLVSMQGGDDVTANQHNGIYYVSAIGDGASAKFTLTRATDADQGTPSTTEMHQGLYVFVTDGTLGANTSWTVVTVDPITVDTTPIKFSQFSGAPSLTYDQGLKRVLSSIQVDLDTVADAQSPGAGGGYSGLEFDVDAAAGKLRVCVNPNGAIERSHTGLAVKLEGSTLELDGSGAGLSVIGVPDLFKIGSTNTSQTPGTGQVTAANLNTLTAGSGSNADALHTHASSAATEAPVTGYGCLAGEALLVGDPVYKNTTNNQVMKGDTDTDTKCAVVGIARTAQPSIGGNVKVDEVGLSLGVLTGKGFTAGQRIYLATNGGLSSAAPGNGKRVIEMGFAKNADDLILRIIDRGRKAA
jgi:hypothetical protein